jgi:hypothetical protein
MVPVTCDEGGDGIGENVHEVAKQECISLRLSTISVATSPVDDTHQYGNKQRVSKAPSRRKQFERPCEWFF